LGGGYGGEAGLSGAAGGSGVTVVAGKNLRIIADDSNNSLVIYAKAEDFKMIEAALRELDVVPLQVHIEASVIEVTLNDALKYGVEWFFQHGGGKGAGRGGLDLGATTKNILAPPLGIFEPPAFSYSFLNQGDVSVLLQAIASKSKFNVLSSPSLMVLDNRKAAIKVVQQVPVQSQQLTTAIAATNQPGSSIATSVQYKDAGVVLEVTPRINAGGRITLELSQDVTDVLGTDTADLTPRFQQRNIKSTVTVQSGETLVLGGLIKNNQESSKSGIPYLSTLPLLGPLFSSTADTANRVELIVLMTPKVVRNQEESRAVTDEFRQRLKELERVAPGGYGSSRTDMGVRGYQVR
jgi:general secretion pathway protein D